MHDVIPGTLHELLIDSAGVYDDALVLLLLMYDLVFLLIDVIDDALVIVVLVIGAALALY